MNYEPTTLSSKQPNEISQMATGLPVIATRVGGNAELVVEGETGLLVPEKRAPISSLGIIGLSSKSHDDAESWRGRKGTSRKRIFHAGHGRALSSGV